MQKWGISIFMILLLVTGCGTSLQSPNKATTVRGTSIASEIPSDSNVTSLMVWSSSLPGSSRKTFTNTTDKATIELVLSWLNNSKEVGLEPPIPGKGGYPPGLSITTKSGEVIGVGPSVNWTVKTYTDHTDISGKNVVGYVAMGSSNNSKAVRLYSPELYKWIVNHEWDPSGTN